jgi:hypothetical protein
MPWSWMRVSLGTSPKLRDCVGDDKTPRRYDDCIHRIAEADGAQYVDVKFDPSGRYAHITFYWENPSVKFAVIYDLEGDQAIDLVGVDDMEQLARRTED